MLYIKDICKKYKTGDLVQKALDHVDISLRDSEFVAILGPSGSGKTTLLNVIGGLDRYDSGELIIDGISTKKYKEKDWDSYRNHKIGFVFQNYNLIPHQTILANVELSLTISGLSRSQRRRKALEALKDVGLEEQAHKRPAQMSGGQMQRVAIARALVNDPQILLADEPTGALDTETSITIMELLKEVAKDRLVVMVTHNPELADAYATRIVRLKDGRITDDSDPFTPDETEEGAHKNLGRASMSFATSLGLSANNLRTKKGRTILTAFAGSIGIVGIALILSLSNGVSTSLLDIQKKTMSSYPITINQATYNLDAIIGDSLDRQSDRAATEEHGFDAIYGSNDELANHEPFRMPENYTIKNNLTSFKKYLDDTSSEIGRYVGDNGIVYSYDIDFAVFASDPDDTLLRVVGSSGIISNESIASMINSTGTRYGGGSKPVCFSEIIPGKEGRPVSTIITDNYDLLYGHWPENANELAFVLDSRSEVESELMYELGYLKQSEYTDIVSRLEAGEEFDLPEYRWDFGSVVGKEFFLFPYADTLIRDGETFREMDLDEIGSYLDKAITLTVSCVIRPKQDAQNASIPTVIAYTSMLTDMVITKTDQSEAVSAQRNDTEKNVVTGMLFDPASDEEKIENARLFMQTLSFAEIASIYQELLEGGTFSGGMVDIVSLGGLGGLGSLIGAPASDDVRSDEVVKELIINSLDEDTLLMIYNERISNGSYDKAMRSLGVVDRASPRSINIYVDTFADKDSVLKCIDAYNETVPEEDHITYRDITALLMESVTDMIDTTSYVLIAFVAVSLVVSSIMIGIITYISVLERTREIGILRALGASKRNISQVFNAETFLIGMLAGIFGVILSLLLLIPINAVIAKFTADQGLEVSASLPVRSALFLIGLSTILTMIGGVIPSKKAAKRDPVAALRSE